jgi:hypothetical protein
MKLITNKMDITGVHNCSRTRTSLFCVTMLSILQRPAHCVHVLRGAKYLTGIFHFLFDKIDRHPQSEHPTVLANGCCVVRTACKCWTRNKSFTCLHDCKTRLLFGFLKCKGQMDNWIQQSSLNASRYIH